MISIEAYRASIGRFYNRLRHFANVQNVVSSVQCCFSQIKTTTYGEIESNLEPTHNDWKFYS